MPTDLPALPALPALLARLDELRAWITPHDPKDLPCRRDHHGYCQEHGWGYDTTKPEGSPERMVPCVNEHEIALCARYDAAIAALRSALGEGAQERTATSDAGNG